MVCVSVCVWGGGGGVGGGGTSITKALQASVMKYNPDKSKPNLPYLTAERRTYSNKSNHIKILKTIVPDLQYLACL